MSRFRRRALALLAGVGAALPGAGPAAAASAASRIPAVAEYLDRLDRLGFEGVVLVAERDTTLLARGYGLADRERQVPWSPATISTVGSITKQFTAAAILALAEDGKLSVEDPITRHFDAVPADRQSITLHHLLTHSSGIVDLEGLDDWTPIARQEFVRRALEQPLAFEPGTGYVYSNAGYSLLGVIVEQLTGAPYERFVRERFFLPAGMRDTGYVLAGWEPTRLAPGYRGGERWGTVLERPMAADGPYWALRANGGIHSTVQDMLRWSRWLLDGRALSPASMRSYWTGHVDEGGGESRYAYGWVIRGSGATKVVTHNGGNGIHFADLAIVPDSRLVVVLQTNVIADFPVANRMLERLVQHLAVGTPLPRVPDVARGNSSDLRRWAGRYTLAGGGSLEVRAAMGGLEIEPADGPAFAMLLSERPVEVPRAQRLSTRIDTIVTAWLAGDVGPLGAAYGGRVATEILAQRARETRAAWDSTLGRITGHRVLGTAFRAERDETLVRIEGERGHVDRTYVWDAAAEERLLGVSARGLDPIVRVLPESNGGFATWDRSSGASQPVRLAATADGVAELVRDGPIPFRARRTP